MSSEEVDGNHSAAVDRSVLVEICDGDAAFERRILDRFRRDIQGDAARLRQAAARRDIAEITAISHAIKGASQTIGAGALARTCACIEGASRAGEWDTIVASFPAFDTEIACACAYIDAVLQEGESAAPGDVGKDGS